MAGPATSDWRQLFRPTVSNRVLWLLCLMYLLLYVDRVNISTAAPLIKKELGFDNATLGLVFAAFAYPYAALQLIGGWLGDVLGARRTLGIFGFIACAATALTGAVSSFLSLYLARFALGVGEGAAFPTATRAMARWLPEGQWGWGQGITHSFARIGNALTPPLIALLIGYLSWRGSFVVLGLVSLVWVAVWVWFFRDEPRQHPLIGADELATLPAARRAEAPRSWRQRLREWPPLARRILPVTAVDFCYGWTLWLFLSWIPSFFYESFHLPLKDSALFSSGVFLAGVIGDTLGGIISDRLLQRSGDVRRARCSVIAAGLFGAFLFLIPVVFVHDLALTALCLSLAFFSAELVVAPIWSVPMDIAPDYAGTASGMMNFGFGLAGMISPWFFGKMIDVTGSWTYPFLGSIALLLFGALMALRLRPDLRFEARAPVTAAA